MSNDIVQHLIYLEYRERVLMEEIQVLRKAIEICTRAVTDECARHRTEAIDEHDNRR